MLSNDFRGARQIYAFDLDSDGDLDVLGVAFYENAVAWWENDGAQHFTMHSIKTAFVGANTVYAGDLDADGDLDVIAGSWHHDVNDQDALLWFENDGHGAFAEHVLVDRDSRNSCLKVADVDEDGDTDILAAVYGSNAILWLENQGGGAFTVRMVEADLREPTGRIQSTSTETETWMSWGLPSMRYP